MTTLTAPEIISEEVSAGVVSAPVVDAEGPGGIIVQSALVNLDETGHVGVNPTWTNKGTGGSDFDFDTNVGTAANRTAITVNGLPAIRTTGGNGLRTSGQTINSPATVFVVARYDTATLSGAQFLFDARIDANARMAILAINNAPDTFRIFQGGSVVDTGNYTTDLLVFSGEFHGDSSTNLELSNGNSATGDAGPDNWDCGTLMADRVAGNFFIGDYCQLVVFNGLLSASKKAAVQSYLSSKWGA